MKVLSNTEITEVSGGVAIGATFLIVCKAIGSAYFYEGGRQAARFTYSFLSEHIKTYFAEPEASSTLTDFNVPASYIAVLAGGFVAGAIATNLLQDRDKC